MGAAAAWIEIVEAHILRRPVMGWQDVYKLLYQGVMGPEHIMASADDFRARLRAEWEALPDGPAEPLCEPIRPDGRLLRFNLRPYRAAGGQLERLAAACLETGAVRFGTVRELRGVWQTVQGALLKKGRVGLEAEELRVFSERVEAEVYPAVHHSQGYREAYQPAYRLLEGDR